MARDVKTTKPLTPVENAVEEAPPASTEPANAIEPSPAEPSNLSQPTPPPAEQPQEPANGV